MQPPKSRILYLDFTKFLAIFFVVWGHSIQYLQTYDFFHHPIFEFIYSFHMPLFMSISGFFALSSLKMPFTQLIKKKLRELILPCMTWGIIITSGIWILKGIFRDESPSINQLYTELKDNFWFLKSVFLCYIITFLSLKIFHKEGIAAFISILFTLLLSQIPYYTSFMLPFFWAGIYIRKYLLNIEKNDHKILPISFLLFIGMLFFWDGDYTIYSTPLNIIHLKALSIDANFIHMLCVALFRFAIGFAGIFFFILSSRKLCEKYPGSRYINYVSSHFGKHTMGIYIIQNLIIERYQYQLIDFGGYNWIYNWIITPGFSIIVILLCSVIIKIIEKNKYTNFLLLGKKLS